VWPQSHVSGTRQEYVLPGIRKVLGDRRDKPLFIETVHKRGYQFVALPCATRERLDHIRLGRQ
jgi:DNA-binding winged helix-turn-helix (wHTH) protein